tara:strand:- start:3326 stop:4012 length:687 start_codon:yes stop_codon:yes gene_type:complete
MIRENKFPVEKLIFPRHVLVSVFDKTGLDVLVKGLLEINPEVVFYSTGGTGEKITEILGGAEENYVSVEDFTRLPEMEGGLVKTLHPKVHAGLLAERNNPAHEEYIEKVLKEVTGSPGVYFDVVVVNVYPFQEVVKGDVNPEKARVNIDIGGPTMIRASAKNWQSVAIVTSVEQYAGLVKSIKENKGITMVERFMLMQRALKCLSQDVEAVAGYFNGLDFEKEVDKNQ